MAARYAIDSLLTLYLAFFCPNVLPLKISNLKICADEGCQKTISKAKTIKFYFNDDPRFLSFEPGIIIHIKSKHAGRVPYLWSGEVDSHVGYFPMSHVKETEVFVKNPSHFVPTTEEIHSQDEASKNSAGFEHEAKVVDETEIEEDDPSADKIEENTETVEMQKDETEIEDEEEASKTIPTDQVHNSKEESITQQADEIMNMYNQINDDLENSNKQISGQSENEAVTNNFHQEHIVDKFHDKSVTDKPSYEPVSDKPHYEAVMEKPDYKPIVKTPQNEMQSSIPEYSEATYHTSDIIKDPMQTQHSDVLQQAQQTHSQQSVSQTRAPDDSASRLIEATLSTSSFASQPAYTVFDGTTLFDGVTAGSEAPQTSTASTFTYKKKNPAENVARAFVETSVTDQVDTSKSSDINIDPSASMFLQPSDNLNPNSMQDTFLTKTVAMHPELEDVPNRERQRQEIPGNGETISFTGKIVSEPTKKQSFLGAEEKKTQPEGANLIKVFDIHLKSIFNMCPVSLQNFLEQEPFGIPPTMLLLYIVAGFSLSFFFFVTCTCFSNTSQKPRTDPVIIIRNLEEKLFITTKEKENLEDELQAIKVNISTLQENVELQKSSTGSAESDLQRQKLLNDELKELNYSLNQQLVNLQTEHEDFRSINIEKEKRLEISEEKNMKLTNEYKRICEEHLQLTQAFAASETENSRLESRVESLTDQIRHLETRKQQLLEEAEEWTEKHRELTENWEQTQAEYIQMRETLDFKENELEQMKECFLELKVFEEESEEAITTLDYTTASTTMQDKIQSMLDVSRVKAMLTAAEEEKNSLQQSRQIEVECRLELEDQIEALKRDVETLQADKAKATRQNDEAQTKLNVLTTYFKEKEIQFQRELGEHEILKKQNINKLGTAEEKAKCFEGELESYRSQIEDLKQEINKAERDFRAQIASNEKKAHENWLATRAAERELKEARMECTMLRQKLTELERRPMPGSIIRPLPTRGSGHVEMVNGPPQLLPFPLNEHPAGRKDLLPATRDEQSKPPMKSPSPNFRPSPRPSPSKFRPPPPPLKKRGPPPLDARDPYYNWQMCPPPRIPFGNRPPPPTKLNPPRGGPFGNHPPPPIMAPQSQLRPLPDFPSFPDKPPTSKQHSQV